MRITSVTSLWTRPRESYSQPGKQEHVKFMFLANVMTVLDIRMYLDVTI